MVSIEKVLLVSVPAILLALAWIAIAGESTSLLSLASGATANFKSLLADTNRQQISTQIKVLLTKAKVRRVPLAKKHSEELLAKLYKERTLLKNQILEWERNLDIVAKNKRHNGLRIIKVDDDRKDFYAGLRRDKKLSDEYEKFERPRVSMDRLSGSVVGNWKIELTKLHRELDNVKRRMAEAKKVIKNPENYISIPRNHHRQDSEIVREREREILIRDRENMLFREAVQRGKIQPWWYIDKW